MPPSTTASTRRSRTTSRRRCIVPRYRATAPREATRNALIRPRSVVRASVSPSPYQDCAVSREKFASGSTASDRIPPALALGHSRPRESLPPERSEEHTSELQSHSDLVCRLLLEKKKETRERIGSAPWKN